MRAAAEVELARREDRWRPIAQELTGWLVAARAAVASESTAKDLKVAEDWIKAESKVMRDARFTPIADQARALWAMLRQQSNVELGKVELSGASTQRRVALEVTVDGTPATAVGVMSQGELHALALSLFLPRATLAGSPFRFIVIDDPVQAMDPARVDGLAKVLASTATTHQVVVFTHDDRLAASLRRQQLPARVLKVVRRNDSQVDVAVAADPAAQAIDDAMALAKTADLPAEVAARVVPRFCRTAIEAAAMDAVRRRDIGGGRPHAEVEARLEKADKLSSCLRW